MQVIVSCFLFVDYEKTCAVCCIVIISGMQIECVIIAPASFMNTSRLKILNVFLKLFLGYTQCF